MPPFATGEAFVAVEGKDAYLPETSDQPAAIPRQVSLSRILHDPQAVVAGDAIDCVHVGRMPIEMDGNDAACAWAYSLDEAGGVDAPGIGSGPGFADHGVRIEHDDPGDRFRPTFGGGCRRFA